MAYGRWLTDDKRLPQSSRQVIEDEDNNIVVSAASAWEIATKHRIGKPPSAGALQGLLRDPFDRMLIAQTLGYNLVFISIETLFDNSGIRRLW